MSVEHVNSFLRNLPTDALAELTPHLSRARFDWSRVVFDYDDAVETIHFPETALLSMLTAGGDGETVETTMVGREGAAGLMEALGSGHAAFTLIVQVDGDGWSAPASACRRLMRENADFSAAAARLFELQLIESRQSGLCQALHGVEQRLARWLVESHDRSGGRNPMPLTQEYVAAMLGVQRTTVNGVASLLQKTGLIRYSRGSLHLLDRAGLEKRACECHDVVVAQRKRLGLEVRPAGVLIEAQEAWTGSAARGA